MPDFNFRYLSEDVPTGLCFTRGVGELLGVKTPSIDKVLLWAQEKLKKEFIGKDRLGRRMESSKLDGMEIYLLDI